MDRSFLSNADVVAASRDFVCIRLATYEDKEEAEFMKSVYTPRSGAMENTTFSILSPDGKRSLINAGRGPHQSFRGAAAMASSMKRLAKEQTDAKKSDASHTELPLMKNVELGLNVAAADGLPLIVTFAKSQDELDALHKQLVQIAWSDKLLGQFVYAATVKEPELKPISGVKDGSQIFVVDPGQFGLSGNVIHQFKGGHDVGPIEATLEQVVQSHKDKRQDHNSHVQFGIQLGIEWQSEIPETDPMSVRAKERARGK